MELTVFPTMALKIFRIFRTVLYVPSRTDFIDVKRLVDPDEKKMAAALNSAKSKKFKKKLDVSN
jgi:hypothetical protein